ncbi:Radical SAM superfamily enzyme, MoaA/NifB/PqqE/SkfB family [Candidatus Electrothrix aarhusensis]|uniref:Radical SAM superfamily enzyme, MoaA/NifB/PqqE/SkfB family n=1 Tax=Candidatus Electrothrix aarhusensis TaxID=1859131 RepID=A0A3S3RT78_9BACT|nr:Radical SAM superfamily enzyme, MoaA/NifB/PqqE/SkfB family [Candidatus Electrothrix aarhusensis]
MDDSLEKKCLGGEGNDLARYFARAAVTHTPLSVSFELTHRCNFRCVHCYLGDQEAIHKHRHRELDTDTILGLLDEMVEAGTLFLTLTGGDPMLRPDFVKIYEHAVRAGLLVSVLCNGSLITNEIVRSFVRYPPRIVDITLYGATQNTFEAITQKDGSFAACLNSIERLRKANVRLHLKTVVMTLNYKEMPAMRAIAKDMELEFRHDCMLHPVVANSDNAGRTNGGGDILRLRIPPEWAVETDFEVKELARSLAELVKKLDGKKVSEELYQCQAGKISCHIDPYGIMQPCLITPSHSTIRAVDGIKAGWKKLYEAFSASSAVESFSCKLCEDKIICPACPGSFVLETGRPEQAAEYYCQYTALRREKMRSLSRKEVT